MRVIHNRSTSFNFEKHSVHSTRYILESRIIKSYLDADAMTEASVSTTDFEGNLKNHDLQQVNSNEMPN